MKKIGLATDTIDKPDLDRLIKWLNTNPRLTKGEQTLELEKRFAKWVGSEYSVFVNSGSSANLLMLYALIEAGHLDIGDKVLVPALSWSTDLAPVIQLGLEPVLVDCNLDDLSIDIDHLISLITTKRPRPKALILVSVLGNVPDMDRIMNICETYRITLLEDVCESMGSQYAWTKLGNFGVMSSFSTYFGHHISTIEGGFIVTNDQQFNDILLGLRSHGWDRDLSDEKQKVLRAAWNVNDFQSLYTFYFPGFNLRSTDLQAYIGLGQLDKLDDIVKTRNLLWKSYRSNLHPKLWKPKLDSHLFVSAFAYPIIADDVGTKNLMLAMLKESGVETRPMICGSMGTQPYFVQRYGELILKNVAEVDEYGFYVPIHHGMTESDVVRVCDIINEGV